MVEWGRLLSGYWGEILSRRFESCPPRHKKHVREGVFSRMRSVASPRRGDAIRILSSGPRHKTDMLEKSGAFCLSRKIRQRHKESLERRKTKESTLDLTSSPHVTL